MDFKEFDILESRVLQVKDQIDGLRQERDELRRQMAAAEAENTTLKNEQAEAQQQLATQATTQEELGALKTEREELRERVRALVALISDEET